jgi:DNA-binding LacI/PurR family transcriptional regulator
MSATMQTVADAVGVSRSTVSNAYSRPDQMSAELRERVLATARELGYPGPNLAARSLRGGRVGAIGVLLTGTLSYALTDPYAIQFLQGLAEETEKRATGLLLIPIMIDDDDAAASTVRNAVVDGYCAYCVPDWHPSLDAVRQRGLPIVFAERRDDAEPDSRYVGIDERAATVVAGRHLTQLGHRHVALVSDYLSKDASGGLISLSAPEDVPYYVSRERLRGYRDALAEVGVPWSAVTTVNAVGNSRAAGEAAASYVLDRAPRPTAVIAITDLLALGVLDALAARGLEPGRDVSVVGFDDIPDAARERLTTVRQPIVDTGRLVAGLLLDPPDDPADRQIVLPTELRVRASTGPAPERNS